MFTLRRSIFISALQICIAINLASGSLCKYFKRFNSVFLKVGMGEQCPPSCSLNANSCLVLLVAGHGSFGCSWWLAWYRRCWQTDSSADTTTSLLLQVCLTSNTASTLEFWKCNILGGEMVQTCVVVNHLLVGNVPVLFATSLACCVARRCCPPKSSVAPIGKIYDQTLSWKGPD